MKHLKNYQSFINEGAYLNDNGQAVIKWENDPENPDEVLKSVKLNITSQDFTGVDYVGKKAKGFGEIAWPIFYSLAVDEYSGKVDSLDRFKATMDALKKGNIEDFDTSLVDFLNQSFKYNGLDKWLNFPAMVWSNSLKKHTRGAAQPLEYIVKVGSSQGLVGKLAEATKKIYPSAQVRHLPKVKYLNAEDAIDWDRLERDRVNQPDGQNSFNKFKNQTVGRWTEEMSPELSQEIKDASSVEELKAILSRQENGIKWLERWHDVQMVPFEIRKSGLFTGGFGVYFKTKYMPDDSHFIEAVLDCAVNGKKMIIIDDNKNSGKDILLIYNNIRDILKGSGYNPDAFRMQFGFYVLYQMQNQQEFSFTRPDDVPGKISDIRGRHIDVNRFRKTKGWD